MRYSRHLLVLILGFTILSSCKKGDPEAVSQNEIRDILYQIETNYNSGHIALIMDYVHEYYLHKGMITWNLNQLWLNRKADFPLLDIEVLFIEIQGSTAIAHIDMTFSSAFQTYVINDPADSGDISYFIRENGEWLIYGNQSWTKP